MANYKTVFVNNLGKNNPVFVQILGICSTLAVTNLVVNTIVMCLALVFTLTLSNFAISALRNKIPSKVRMMAEVLIISFFVIVADMLIKAFSPEISAQLGPYVGLIITNCIIMGRAEAFALNNKPIPSLIDGFSAGIGYSYVLLAIAIIREIMGSGTLMGIQIMGGWWVNWSIMVMASGAFFVLAIFIWIVKEYIILKESKG